jgi:hypothetical protein
MQTIGNILLVLSLIAGGSLFISVFLTKNPGGDAAIGQAYATLFTFASLWVCITLLVCITGFAKGFQWLSLGRFASAGMLAVCFLIMIAGANIGLESGYKSIRILGLVAAVATPVVLMAASGVLLNENLKMAVPASIVKWGLGAILGLNSLVLAMMLLGMVWSNMSAFASRSSGELSDFEIGIANRIDTFDVSKGIASLLIYSGDNQPRQLQEKAVAKIKSKPDWQEDILKALEDNNADDAFRFLLSNEVNDKASYAKGVYQGVLSQARMVRERLHRCWHKSHVYDDMFGTEVRRTLKTVEKFKGLGVDFKPAMQDLRAALDEPNPYGNLDVSSKRALDKWLKSDMKK